MRNDLIPLIQEAEEGKNLNVSQLKNAKKIMEEIEKNPTDKAYLAAHPMFQAALTQINTLIEHNGEFAPGPNREYFVGYAESL